jgi:Trp operon repressor
LHKAWRRTHQEDQMTKIIRGLLLTTKDGDAVEFRNPIIATLARRPISSAVVWFFLGLLIATIRL